ncbi:MAG TPA: hypothetical protein VH300_00835 [Thermoleophilaceae bacterium]|nr:hypothetical protein [Thermoleophilaceae bacterium]
MGFLDKAKATHDLSKAYHELGETAFKLVESGAIAHPELKTDVARIRELEAKLNERPQADTDPTEAVEQPLSGAGPGGA